MSESLSHPGDTGNKLFIQSPHYSCLNGALQNLHISPCPAQGSAHSTQAGRKESHLQCHRAATSGLQQVDTVQCIKTKPTLGKAPTSRAEAPPVCIATCKVLTGPRCLPLAATSCMRVLITSAGWVARVATTAAAAPEAKLTPVLDRPSCTQGHNHASKILCATEAQL